MATHSEIRYDAAMTNRAEDDPADNPYREQIERFRTLFARSPNFAAVLIGPDHRFLLANPAYERLVGGRAILGKPIAEALPEVLDQGFVEVLDDVRRTGEAHVGRDTAVTLGRDDGTANEHRLDFVYQPIQGPSGEIVAIFVEGTDVTERFRAAEALRESEARNRQILDSALDYAIIAIDLDGLVTRWNRGAEMTLGWSEAEMLGRPIDCIFPEEDRVAGRMRHEMTAASTTGRGAGEGWRLRKSGERFWAHGEMTPLRNDDGDLDGFVKVLRDRTAEHAAAEALQASEERLRRAQEAGGVGVFSVDIASGQLEPSPQFCRLFGLRECDVLPAAAVEALVVPDDVGKASSEDRRVSGNLDLTTEYRIRRANDGAIRTISRRAEFERDDDGRILRMLGVVQDVTEQRLAQAAIAESEARFRAFAEAVPNQVWSATPEGRLDWANQRTFDYDGHDLDRLTEHGWETQVHPDDLSRTTAAWSDAIATGEPYKTEFRLRRADGAFRWHIARAVPLRNDDGAIERWIGTNTDIHDERVARDELASLNATLEQRVEERTRERDLSWKNSRDLQAVIGKDGRFLAANAAWTTILGLESTEVVGKSHLDFAHPDDHAASEDALAIARDAPLPPHENRFRHKDGSWRWISWVAAPDNGKIYASGRHVTAEREAAAALEAAQEQLRHAQKMEAIGQLTGGVAHDFNNLLTVIIGSIDLLRRDGVTPERRARYIDAIGSTADRASKLTGQLLAFARRQALKPELFDAGDSIKQVAAMVGTLTGSRVTLDVQVHGERCLILADRSQFDTAIVNMGINARDAMNGEGTLTIATRAVAGIPPLRGHAAVAGDFVAITMADSGAGIAPDAIERIFEPFYTTKPVGHGTGLGLSQVIGFAKQSGGDISVDSEIGEGTTFTLYLPRAPADANQPLETSAIEPVDGGGTHVLIVEDNEQVGEFATSALRELGYETELATSAEGALDRLAQPGGSIRIVFSDVVMPGITGIELAEEIQRRGHAVAVLLTSGYSHVLAQRQNHGFDLLHKPYSIDQLSRALRKALRRNGHPSN